MNTRVLAVRLIVALLATVTLSTYASSSTTRYYGGATCSPETPDYDRWQTSGEGIGYLYSNPGDYVDEDGRVFCAFDTESTSINVTSWRVQYYDNDSSNCIECHLYIRTPTGGLYITASKYSASTAGGDNSCPSGSYTGYNYLQLSSATGTQTIAAGGIECTLPERGTGVGVSFVKGFNVTY